MKQSPFIETIFNSLTSSRMWRGCGLLCLMLALTACSSDDEEQTGAGATTVPNALTPGTDQRPNWTEPDNSQYEFFMSLQVQLGDTLASFQKEQDLMCATIGGEVRAVSAALNTQGELYYSLCIGANGGETPIDLSYYCDSLHRIYTIKDWAVFNSSAAPAGDSGIYRPKFTATVK